MDQRAKTDTPTPSSALRGEIGPVQLFALGFGPIVGSAWVVILGDWLGAGGPGGAILGFIAGALIMVAIGACYAELTARAPMTGGEFTFTRRVYGRFPGFVVGWFIMLCWVCVTVLEGLALGWFAELLVPQLRMAPLYRLFGADVTAVHLAIGLLGALVIAFVNYSGSRAIVRFQSIFTYGFLAVAGAILSYMLLNGDARNIAPAFPETPDASWKAGALSILASAAFMFNGFQSVAQAVEERSARMSLRTVGWIMIAVIAAAGAFYCLVILAASLAAPWEDLANAELALLAAVRTLPGGVWLGSVLIGATMASLVKTWNSTFLMAVRTLVALGRERMAPSVFASVHRESGTPRAAVFLVAALNIAGLVLGRGAIISLVDMSAASVTLCFLLCSAAVLILRNKDKTRPAFSVPGGVATICLAMAGSLIMMGSALVLPLFESEGLPLLHALLVGWLTLGAAFWVFYGARRRP